MNSPGRMTAQELRASIALSSVFGLRLFGMFVIMPVFAIYAEGLPGGHNLTLVGIAIGAYGLTQAILQIPYGWWSDRYGRGRVVYIGLSIFAAGSFVAAAAPNLYVVIAGRVLQGAGAVSAAVIALLADLTREEQRTKAMAMVGSTIGAMFALSLVLAPWLSRVIGVPGIFALTGFLAMAAIFVVWRVAPRQASAAAPPCSSLISDLRTVVLNQQLARLNWGIFALHAVLMALFIVVPFEMRNAGLAVEQHWKIYLPVMLVSFVLMLPAVFYGTTPAKLKAWFSGSVGLLLLAQLVMPWLMGTLREITLFLLIFFTAFNALEAMLPSLISRMAPAHAKGAAIGIYSSVQFLGTFVGAAGGGFLYSHWGPRGIVVPSAVLLAIWLILALGMQAPAALRGKPAGDRVASQTAS